MLPTRNGDIEGLAVYLIERDPFELLKESRNPVRDGERRKHGQVYQICHVYRIGKYADFSKDGSALANAFAVAVYVVSREGRRRRCWRRFHRRTDLVQPQQASSAPRC